MTPEAANRERLVQFLRDEHLQQSYNFTWDFSTPLRRETCGTAGCAIGGSVYLGIIDYCGEALAPAIGLPAEAECIFLDCAVYDKLTHSYVTAEMVADMIEAVAAGSPIPHREEL